MIGKVRNLLFGNPLPTQQLAHARLNSVRALAAFSPDALSSIAYANQEIYLALIVAGSVGLSMTMPIGLAIAGLLALVAVSYYQTIQAYTSGGGSYAVARENLGTLPGLVAAAALLVGYLLTAAVSLTAGVEAIASAFPSLWPHRVTMSLVLLAIIAWINLRGARETGTLMSIPVYTFLATYLATMALGLVRLLIEGPTTPLVAATMTPQPVTFLLLLRAFASGCTALTGIEAISNGVPSFRPPEAKNAGQTLMVMALLMVVLFVSSVGLTQAFGIVAGSEETILSALARRLLGSGPAYIAVQVTTMLILTVAANTSFAGFPRLAAILASDGFLPRQLTNLGDRLVFANGILLLSAATGVLIVVFGGDTHSLIPLFAVGVFLAFTLSQAGMVVHWFRVRGRGWGLKAFVNGVGTMATAATVVVVGISRFIEGAWITVLLVPVLVFAFRTIRAHYQQTEEELSLGEETRGSQVRCPPRVVVPISGVHRGILDAIDYAKSIARDVTVVYVEIEPGSGQHIREEWYRHKLGVPLVVVPSPYRSVIGPLLDYLDETDSQHDDGQLATVVLPESVSARWWHNLLHNQTAWLIKAALLYRRRNLGFQRVIVDVPYHLQQ